MPIRSLRHLRGALATVALASVSLASFAFAASADARPTPAKPTVVLVHGAFADSSGFDGSSTGCATTATPSAPHRTRWSICSSTARPSAVSLTASRAPRSWSVTPTAAQ